MLIERLIYVFRKLLEAFNKSKHVPVLGAKDILKYIGPGLIVTVGFIDPGNWAANVSAGAFLDINFYGW